MTEGYQCSHAIQWQEPSRFFKKGRECRLTGEICWNWHNPEAVATCIHKKEVDRRKPKNEVSSARSL